MAYDPSKFTSHDRKVGEARYKASGGSVVANKSWSRMKPEDGEIGLRVQPVKREDGRKGAKP